MLNLVFSGFLETLFMTLVSVAFAYIIGLPIGLALVVTAPEGIKPARGVNAVLGVIVNILRSVPFLILLVAVVPLTRLIMGTAVGSAATVVPDRKSVV